MTGEGRARLFIFSATVLAFSPALAAGFVNWDDPVNITHNPRLLGSVWSAVSWAIGAVHMGHYMPVTWLTIIADRLLWGGAAAGAHATSLLFHAANAVLFFEVLRELLRGRTDGNFWPAAAGALLFSLHPLRAESVVWATERRDVVSGFFYLLTILLYLRDRRPGGKRRGWPALASFSLTALSRGNAAATLPATLLILDAWPLGRFSREKARDVLLEKIPYFLIAFASGAALFAAAGNDGTLSLHRPFSNRLLSALYGAGFYPLKTLVPAGLGPLYVAPRDLTWARAAGPVLFFAALTAAVAVAGRPALWAAFGHYLVTQAPSLGTIESWSAVNDRYGYLSCLGWAGLGAAVFSVGGKKWMKPASAAVLSCLFLLSFRQSRFWKDSLSLWTRAVDVSPGSATAWAELGRTLFDEKRLPEAEAAYRRAADIHVEAAQGLPEVLHREGKDDEAEEMYRRFLRRPSADPELLGSYGRFLLDRGRFASAAEVLRAAAAGRVTPVADDFNNLGLALKGLGRTPEADAALDRALALDPASAEACNNRGISRLEAGRPAEALPWLEKSLALDPASAEAHANLAVALEQTGRVEEAAVHFARALELDPASARAHFNFAALLEALGRPGEARSHFDEAVRLDGSLAAAVERARGKVHGLR